MSPEDMLELPVTEASALMRAGGMSAEAYADAILRRCREMAALNAFITIDADAVLAAARRADQARKAGQPLGRLHGIPVAIKDNIDAAGLPATAGSPGLMSNVPRNNANIVKKFVAAGAIVLGKTNMHELAAGATTKNARFGFARNPYKPDHVPGGSSGGTAVAVAARMAPCGIGTDTGGSNRIPAAYCGIIGFRPTTGRWSQAGLILNSVTRDTAGPMTRTMADCILLDTIATGAQPASQAIDLRNLRLGIPRGTFWSDSDPEVTRVAEDCLARLREAGIQLVEADIDNVYALSDRASLPLGMCEHAPSLTRYLAEAGSDLDCEHVLSEVASPDVKAFLGTHLGTISEAEYREARDVHRPALQASYASYFKRHSVDAILFPTSPILPPKISDGDTLHFNGRDVSTLFTIVRNTNPGSVAGIPGLSLPAGMAASGLPVGIEFDGPIDSDARLLAIGAAIERLLPGCGSPGRA